MLAPFYVNADPKFVEWEDRLTRAIEESLEVTRSDAQAIVEGQPKAIKRAWERGHAPERAATDVVRAASPHQGPEP